MVNVSEGRRPEVVADLAAAAGGALLDVHVDPDHHRSVFTLAGPDVEGAVRSLARRVVARLTLADHHGVHPRIGTLDVVPFVALDGATPADAVAARDRFAEWAGTELALPCFCYGTGRELPEVRRRAFRDLSPDTGPQRPHPTAGAAAVGARDLLVAYNVVLAGADLARARAVAAALRSPAVRALGLAVAAGAQVSMNLVRPLEVGPAEVVDAIAVHAEVAGTELVGLVPAAVLERIDPARWAELDLDPGRTIESRLAGAGLA